ncbi:helix-turn-helix domain-containing protein [Streptomyces sp. L7]
MGRASKSDARRSSTPRRPCSRSRGYAATSIGDLGRAVGLAKGALYYYIGSKENLLIEIQSRVLRPAASPRQGDRGPRRGAAACGCGCCPSRC